ncbi:RNA-binding protein 6 isoform X2 [Sphaeramia orbicularis]|uniref:RNA-binding protein 6-like n=1 Tax=Sphaeramia orbicularis TaxID=375764 RepID=A0A672YZ78_9TELE|nr:RNA-binding protein 6-like isoform X2 [Sphaeramia orbicularis]
MWDGPGPGQGPRGGPPFRGDHRGEMFGGRDRPMPEFRGRDGMYMGPMGHMGPRPLDLPPVDMRRMDGPTMRGREMDPRDMGGREPHRDFFRHEEEADFSLRRQFESSIREKLNNTSGFAGPGRNSGDMGGRGMPPREPGGRFMDMRDRDAFHYDMPRFNNPNNDGRRGFPMDRMERNDGFRDMRDRPPMGMGDTDRYDTDMPTRERRMIDPDRRGGPPFNPRGGFDSDMDFRNRPGPSAEFRGRDRSPLRFGNSVPPVDRARTEMPPDVSGPQRSEFMGIEDTHRDREYPDSGDSPLMDYRSGEEMTLAEEWKNRRKEKTPFAHMAKGLGAINEPSFNVGFGREGNVRDPPPFPERDRTAVEFPGKDVNFPCSDRFGAMDLPSIGSKAPQDHPQPLKGPLGSESESKHWLEERDPKHSQTKPNQDERPTYLQDKNEPTHKMQEPRDCFEGLKDVPHNQGPARTKMGTDRDFQSSSTVQPRDQDYRDIDYRTGSARVFDYKHEDLQTPEKLLKESKPVTPSKFSESGSQDQDYRSAAVEDKVSSTISIIGIPKTATMEQILGAFAVREGVPMQGMKIKNVVPGYSYDTANVEFLNLEDAVHFMESNKGSLKVGTRTASMKYIQPEDCERSVHASDHKVPHLQEPQLPRPEQPVEELKSNVNGSKPPGSMEPLPQNQWQRNSDLTPEAWQQQVDQQLQQQESEQRAESWTNRNPPHHNSHQSDSVFRDSKTMIIKNVKPTTTVETILKALDPFAYLDERNVRLVKAKTPGAKCFCFVDMDSHEQVRRLVELLTKPRPLYIDGVRVYAEVAKPLKNQNFRRDFDKANSSILSYPPDTNMTGQHHQQQPQQQPPPPQQFHHQHFPHPPAFMPSLQMPACAPGGMQGDMMAGSTNPALPLDHSMSQGGNYSETPAVDPSYQAAGHVPPESGGMTAATDESHGSQTYVYGTETPDTTNYLYDATSGFYYDPETTFYYDPNSRYFYNAQTQEYMYWDATLKTYIPVPGGSSAETQPVPMTAEDQAILSNPAADAPLEMKKPSALPLTTAAPAPAQGSTTTVTPEPVPTSVTTPEKKEDEESIKKDKEKDSKDEKPKSLAAVKIMKDMERWAKIQNRQKESVRSPSPVLKTGMDDDRRQSKSADAGFAIFERKISGGDDLFKKPLAPPKKDEKSKRPMGSLGLLASDYAAGSDEEIEEDKEEAKAAKNAQGSQPEDKEDKLTDWKKMACLLCRRQFPNKDALIRHQQLSDLHKQNMEIHLKIKRSKKELEALENQEKELSARESTRSPEQKRRKHQQQHHNAWAGSSREMNKVSERPGLGAEPAPKKKKAPVVWDHTTYKQAVRKAMFARFKELE